MRGLMPLGAIGVLFCSFLLENMWCHKCQFSGKTFLADDLVA